MGDTTKVVPRVVAVVGATRSIGRSTVALNLAAAGRGVHRVCLLDASAALASRGDRDERPVAFADVVLGRARLADALARRPDDIDVLTLERRHMDPPLPLAALLAHVDALERHYDLVVVDAPAGSQGMASFFAAAATEVVFVVTPHAPAIRHAQTLLRALAQHCGRREVLLLPNACRSPEDATAVVQALGQVGTRPPHVRVLPLGWIPFDDALGQANAGGRAVVESAPECPSARAFVGAAQRLLTAAPGRPTGGAQFFFQTLIGQGRAA
jgi:MinD-like ATPase involved in chromosome partitioning or flagellar assembly